VYSILVTFGEYINTHFLYLSDYIIGQWNFVKNVNHSFGRGVGTHMGVPHGNELARLVIMISGTFYVYSFILP
jgi:hypothetical protein